MKIERIKIDGFGRFERWEASLAPGLNVFFGENEAGKSTLLSFVRATLFGFSKRTEPSRYEPERGPFGGELLLDTAAGPLWVRRVGSRRRYEGELSLRTGSGERALPLRLSEAMGGISRQLFFQGFAFGLTSWPPSISSPSRARWPRRCSPPECVAPNVCRTRSMSFAAPPR